MVPFVRIKLDMSILLGFGLTFSFSAYSLIKVSTLFLLTTVFSKVGGKLKTSRAIVQALQYHIEPNQRVTLRKVLARVVLR